MPESCLPSGVLLIGVTMIADYFPTVKGLIIDMDGVLWNDNEPIGDLPIIFNKINQIGYKIILATNNPTRTIEEYLKKLMNFGVKLEAWQVINSAQALGIFLKQKYPVGANVYAVGETSFKKTLAQHGMRIVDEEFANPDVVAASVDFQFSYEKLKHASLKIQKGSIFVGTNPDATFPTPEGLIPGGGSIIGAIQIASGQDPIIIGKPEPALYEMALSRLQLKPGETLAVGDRYETDILGAKAAGIHSALVLTGATSLEAVNGFNPQPDIICDDLWRLIY